MADLDDALAYAGNRRATTSTVVSLAGLEVRPLPHQEEILEALDAERRLHDRHRNLVKAAGVVGRGTSTRAHGQPCAVPAGRDPGRVGLGEPRSKAYGHSGGVVWSEAMPTDALLVNLHKSEKDFSPSTMYRAYAISSNLFHWESQNTTTTSSPTGRRYLSHRECGSHVVLFVRDAPTDDLGAAPFLCLGQVDYVEHRGERPIAITWRLRRPMPADTFAAASAAVVRQPLCQAATDGDSDV